MHELSVCGSIADIVTRHAAGRRVATIHLRIGQLRQIVPDTLAYCWSLASADTELSGSALDVESVLVRVECRACGQTCEIDYPALRCDACDGVDVHVVAGEEFLVTSLDLVGV